MEIIEDKFASFSAAVEKEAVKKREEIIKISEEKRKKAVEEKENMYLEEAYEDIQNVVSRCRKENGERVLKCEMSLKKQLLLRREEMIDEVFAEVKKKISDFAESGGYKNWLTDIVKEACAEAGAGAKKIYVTETDMKYKTDIERIIDGAEVLKADGADIIGGARVYNTERKLVADFTIKNMLEEQRNVFLQKSGLSVG